MVLPTNKRKLAAKYTKDGRGNINAGLPFRINGRITSRVKIYKNLNNNFKKIF